MTLFELFPFEWASAFLWALIDMGADRGKEVPRANGVGKSWLCNQVFRLPDVARQRTEMLMCFPLSLL